MCCSELISIITASTFQRTVLGSSQCNCSDKCCFCASSNCFLFVAPTNRLPVGPLTKYFLHFLPHFAKIIVKFQLHLNDEWNRQLKWLPLTLSFMRIQINWSWHEMPTERHCKYIVMTWLVMPEQSKKMNKKIYKEWIQKENLQPIGKIANSQSVRSILWLTQLMVMTYLCLWPRMARPNGSGT